MIRYEGSNDSVNWMDITDASAREWGCYKHIRSREVETAEERAAKAAPELLALAHYASRRGEGDAEMARGILDRMPCDCEECRERRDGFTVFTFVQVPDHAGASPPDCPSCGRQMKPAEPGHFDGPSFICQPCVPHGVISRQP